LVLDLGSFDDREPHAGEDLFHPIADDGERVAVTGERLATWKRHVDATRWHLVARRLLVRLPADLDRLLQLVGVAADVLLLINRRAGNRLHPRRDDAVLASEVAVAHGLRVTDGLRRRELALELGDVLGDGV